MHLGIKPGKAVKVALPGYLRISTPADQGAVLSGSLKLR